MSVRRRWRWYGELAFSPTLHADLVAASGDGDVGLRYGASAFRDNRILLVRYSLIAAFLSALGLVAVSEMTPIATPGGAGDFPGFIEKARLAADHQLAVQLVINTGEA